MDQTNRIYNTHIERLDLTTIVADCFQDLLHFCHETMMVDGFSQPDDTKMARTFVDAFLALFAFEVSINSTEVRIIWALCTRSYPLLIPIQRSEEMIVYLEQALSTTYKVSGYMMSWTDRRSLSLGEKTPNLIS